MTAHSMFDVAGATALVTGSSRGIGLALARGLLSAEVTVVLHGRDQARLAAVHAELAPLAAEHGAHLHQVAFDVTDPGSVRTGIDLAEQLTGGLDILVNNAGVQQRGPFTDLSDEDWYRLLNTNLTSAFLL